MLWVDLLSVKGVRGNRKNPINSFWGRESDETEASAPLKRELVEERGNMFRGVIEWLVHLVYSKLLFSMDKNTGLKTEPYCTIVRC